MRTHARLILLLAVLLLLFAFWWTRRISAIDSNQASAVVSLPTESSGSNFSESESDVSGPAPGQEAIILVGSGSNGLRLKLETIEDNDGRFELKSDLKLAE